MNQWNVFSVSSRAIGLFFRDLAIQSAQSSLVFFILFEYTFDVPEYRQ